MSDLLLYTYTLQSIFGKVRILLLGGLVLDSLYHICQWLIVLFEIMILLTCDFLNIHTIFVMFIKFTLGAACGI